MARSAALKKLVNRNLTEKKLNENGEVKRTRLRRAEKKLRRQKRELRRTEDTKSATGKAISKTTGKPAAKTTASAELTEIENLKREIAKEIDVKATYVKRQFRAEVPPGWEGLTPGLAPVGYDPDESDSDEDPY